MTSRNAQIAVETRIAVAANQSPREIASSRNFRSLRESIFSPDRNTRENDHGNLHAFVALTAVEKLLVSSERPSPVGKLRLAEPTDVGVQIVSTPIDHGDGG